MDSEEATQATQGVLDPRRVGLNNSGLSEADVSDVMCILHPCSPAAFRIVAATTNSSPQNVLQNDAMTNFLLDVSEEEQETFILGENAPQQAMDLALRFSTSVKNPALGFTFGRSPKLCDIVLDSETFKRVSNVHFAIFVNNSGVLMLGDMSTNGTIVDDVLLKGKLYNSQSRRMLNHGSVIQILSPQPDDIVKFIVRIPSREGHIEEYERKFQAFMQRVALASKRPVVANALAAPAADGHITQANQSVKAPLVQHQFGMHWSGGDKYNVVGLIGKGAFATVFQLATKSEGQLFAAKELEKRRFIKNGILDRKLDNEMQIMKSINHKHIVQYVDYVDHYNHMYIIMEFVAYGDLGKYISNNVPLGEDLAKTMASQVLDALDYLHDKQITHRDIKPDNILIANADPANFTVKLSDFGLSKVVKDNETFLKTFCGTLLYCAPEVFPHYDNHVAVGGRKRQRGKSAASKFHGYNQSVDIWSFGAVLWYSLCLRPPFEGVADNNGRGMFDKIMLTPLNVTDLIRHGVSDRAIALLVNMLNIDPAARPSPAQCLRHKWFGHAESAFTDTYARKPTYALGAIDEEEEIPDAPDVAALSLDEHDSTNDSGQSELSIHSGSLDFFDPRQSKRFKTGADAYRTTDEMTDSSSELFFQTIPIMHQPDAAPQAKPAQKLFGEISHIALEAPPVLSTRSSGALGNLLVQDNDINRKKLGNVTSGSNYGSSLGSFAPSSLLGAESLVRELKMESPQPSHNLSAGSEGPTSPATPRRKARTEDVSSVSTHDDITPKQPTRSVFNRQINLPIPASFYYEAHNPATHTLEYASKVSGYDYVNNSSSTLASGKASTDISEVGPGIISPTGAEAESRTTEERRITPGPILGEDLKAEPTENPAPLVVQQNSQLADFVRPPPRLGRLVSTEDSFTSITLNLTNRLSMWGRDPTCNTHVFADKYDTRIPKRGILIIFHADGIEKFADNDDSWTKLPDLHCVISTESRTGIHVNGVLLKNFEPGRRAFGRVHTGDEILIVDGQRGVLKFVCEFFHGKGADRRPEGALPFKIEMESPGPRTKTPETAVKENAHKTLVAA